MGGAAEKDSAWQSVERWLNPAQPVVLRLNDTGTEWFHKDVVLCGRPGLAAVMLPKTESAGQVTWAGPSYGSGRMVRRGTGAAERHHGRSAGDRPG